ncbi:TonB-dependent receptor [Sphingomonas sp. SRS2]|uniref:TonB-dependent receptor n=1 Tax=Sphingomonas sp. SRS2 TaxID=133190 RepID=UPI0006184B8A|nr:TonB-dependent receptor [Sphingomonas sp. SRS2]KKC26902.1 TonB-dependent receptor [Sphingomonas sp. SRS2]
MTRTTALKFSVAVLGLSTTLPAFASEAEPDYHKPGSSEIIVTAPIHRDRMDLLSGASVLTGAQLTTALRPTIGETLGHTPGVSATSFGPNASRPILRGLQGERVRVLTDGIGSVDVSNTSVDHAVVVNPLLAERVEVLRGPVALLYGSAAIGGVVNVIDKRIPRAIPDEPIHVAAIASYGSAASERSAGVSIDAPIGGGFVAHLDGSYLKTDDLRIGGHALTRQGRADALASALLPSDPDADEPIDFAANAAIRGKLPNSAAKTWVAGAGLSYINGDSHYGLSYSRYDSLYGVPIRLATLPGQEQEAPRIDIVQNRLDARAEIATGGAVIEKIRARLAYAQYRHFELEPDGAIGTRFDNHGYEGRIELVQAGRGAWHGATGMQFLSRDFDVAGEEAFLPRNATQQIGVFTLQQLDYGQVKVEGGVRYEKTWLSSTPFEDQPQFFSGNRNFDAVSASLGASYGLNANWRVGANLLRTERAPSAEELFANGPHAGTEAFEIGDPDFRKEKSWGVEAVVHGKGAGFTIDASVYHSWFDNFIYDSPDGTLEDGLPVFRNFQAKARYYGAEIEGTLDLATVGAFAVKADALADYVHAEIVGVGPAPRIPPLRLLGGLSAASDRIDGRVEVEWTDKARRLSAFETGTRGFTMVNASLNFRPLAAQPGTTIVLSANNIFDVNARRHASYLKDFAPLAGRDIRVTARVSL